MPKTSRALSTILEQIRERRFEDLRQAASSLRPRDAVDLLRAMEKPERMVLFRALPRGVGSRAFALLEPDESERLLRDLSDEEARQVMAALPADDRATLLSELPAPVTQRLLSLLAPDDLQEVRKLLGYPEESVGRLMTPDYLSARPEWTAGEAIERLRGERPEEDAANAVYVTDEAGRLKGVVTLRRLLLAPPDRKVRSVMDEAVVMLSAFEDREKATELMRRYRLNVLPVIDSSGILLGVVTPEDALEVAAREATEDFQKVGAVEPLPGSFARTGILRLVRSRVGWLLVLVFVNMISGAAIAGFEEIILRTVALVFFLPLLIASAGNAGAQSATLVVRALATGEIGGGDWLRLMAKEAAVAGLLGLVMGAAVAGVGAFRAGIEVGAVVAISMVAVVIIGGLIGVALPFALGRLKLDPATASVPLVTSIADITGVVIYFSIALAVLGKS